MKKMFFSFLFLLVLLVSFSNKVNAQTCPPKKVAVIWMNGINGISDNEWNSKVIAYGDTYRAAHNPPLNNNCVVFDSVFNHSGVILIGSSFLDISQSVNQLAMLENHNVDMNDTDYLDLLDRIEFYAYQNYKVILVGHSQGSIYANLAYEGIKYNRIGNRVPSIPSLPDNSKLEIVNIATPARLVSDGNGRYTTQCGDAILLFAPFSLRANINTGSSICGGQLASTTKHSLETYMTPGSETQKQIYADLDLALRLQDASCGGVAGCQLNDTFSDDSFTDNFIVNPYDPGSIKEESGKLQINVVAAALPGQPIIVVGKVTARTRRVFTGPFTASLRFNSTRHGDSKVYIGLMKSEDNSGTTVDLSQVVGWHTLAFTKTNTEVKFYYDGTLFYAMPSSSTDGYFLKFDTVSDSASTVPSTLLMDDVSVTTGSTSTPPPPPPPATGTINAAVSGYSGSVSCQLDGVSVSIPRSFTNQPIGRHVLLCAPPSGYSVFSILPSNIINLTEGMTSLVVVNLRPIAPPPVQTGTIVITTNGTVPSVACRLNGVRLTGPGIFPNQSVGSKTLTCTAPSGFNITSITPSATQNLVAGGTITFRVNLAPSIPEPSLGYFNIDSPARVNLYINLSLFGSGFNTNTKVYQCTSSSRRSSCIQITRVTFVHSGKLQIATNPVSTPRRVYIRVANENLWSGYLTLRVTN